MEKTSLAEISIVFSIKIDSKDRLENLKRNLQFHSEFFSDLDIVIVEQDETSRILEEVERYSYITHFFYPSNNCHNKSRNLNLGTNLSKRDIVMVLDVDIIYEPNILLRAIYAIRMGAHFVAPYNGILVNLKKGFFSKYSSIAELLKKLVFFDRNFLELDIYNFQEMEPLHGELSDTTGGCILYTKIGFYNIGGWNPNFISYGFEDMEFVYRINKFGYTLLRFEDNNLYHFEHQRGFDSHYNNFWDINKKEWENVTSYSLEELKKYVHNGFKNIRMDSKTLFDYSNNTDEYKVSKNNNTKIDCSELSFIIPMVSYAKKEDLLILNKLLEYLDRFFHSYEIVLVEMQTRNCKFLVNRKNYKYFWLGFHPFNYLEVVKKAVAESLNDYITILHFSDLPDLERFRKAIIEFLSSPTKKSAVFNDSQLLVTSSFKGYKKNLLFFNTIEITRFITDNF